MCGIAGFIGKSNNYNISYKIISEIFKNLDVRGEDASGFWASCNDKIIYHKEPVKSSIFCLNNPYWHYLKNHSIDLILTHARGASPNYGDPLENRNNHPFTNNNKNIALVHNGKVDMLTYDKLKDFFNLSSDCDSELYLKFIESKVNIMDGIKEIWSYLNNSHMSIVIAEFLNKNDKNLFLFRNEYRSLWLIDAREYLNQIFFVSTKEIWEESIANLRINFNKFKFIEINPQELYKINLKSDNINIIKYNIEIRKKLWFNKIYKKNRLIKKEKFQIITGLNENESVNYKLLPTVCNY